MSPLLSVRPSRERLDKAPLPGGLFSAAPACSLDSLPIMADTQRTDYFTHGHTTAGARPPNVPVTGCLKLITAMYLLRSGVVRLTRA
ncbi:hypothetical protein EYF80_020100 [Liparis tanakae]|uniref:Uncharacterized protein n=1 Tax=Liparis tanakae TaxID=230148 RepID=A0A4Z2HV65_9TELE|nr:hypothetical protein EYF80_020100 [Liparis tanakae]